MRNKYKGICYYCGETVEVGEGHFERDRATRSWKTIHADCVFKQRNDKGQVPKQKHMKFIHKGVNR